MNGIFFAFTGPAIQQDEKFFIIGEKFECWNLKKINFEDFLENIKIKIPPRGPNMLKHYSKNGTTGHYGIDESKFAEASWGLLLPEDIDTGSIDNYYEILFLLNLYSKNFLYPIFYVTDFGISRIENVSNTPNYCIPPMACWHYQNKASIFKQKNFIDFYEMMKKESVYGAWNAHTSAGWEKEDWRLFVACLLFKEQKKYNKGRDIFTWQKEAAEIATIFEALLTADGNPTEVSYRLKKRSSVMLSHRISTIEQEIKKLYDLRSNFVHGSFFQKIYNDIQVKDKIAMIPLGEFEFLEKQKESARLLIVTYLNLHNLLSQGYFGEGQKTVINLIEDAIINIELREKIQDENSKILNLLPT